MQTLQHVGHKVTWRLRQDNQVKEQEFQHLADALSLIKILANEEQQTGINEHGQPVYKIVYHGETDYFNLSPIWKMQ